MLAEAISAGANILGGILGSNEKAKDRKLQKQFAQEGIRWKVADAKAAGLHPLAALGAQTMSFSPVSVGGSDLSSGLAAAGQDVSRAINATRTKGERVDAYTKTIQDLNLRRMGLENDLLASQIAKINQAGTPPPFPSQNERFLVAGQPDSGIKTSPMERQSVNPLAPNQEAGTIADLGFSRSKTGWNPVMSKDLMDRMEEDAIGSLMWSMRNRVYPAFGANMSPPTFVDPGNEWWFNPFMGEYQQFKPSRWYKKRHQTPSVMYRSFGG